MKGEMNRAAPYSDLKTNSSPIRNVISAAADYWRARCRLFTTEARHAGSHVGIMGALAFGLLFLFVAGYILLIMASVFGLAALIGGNNAWAWGTLAAAGIHFAVAATLFVILRRKAKEPLFPKSREEFIKDQQWLTQKPKH